MEKTKKNNLPQIAVLIIVILAVLYYVPSMIITMKTEKISTEDVSYATVGDSVTVDAWIIRNEEILDIYAADGVLNYQVDDGGKVSKGGTIASIFATEEDAAADSMVQKLNLELYNIESLGGTSNSYSGNVGLIGSQIADGIVDLLQYNKSGNYSLAENQTTKLKYLLSEKQIILGNESIEDYDARVTELTTEKETILATTSESTGKVTSSSSGFFISDTDGYEGMLGVYDNSGNFVKENVTGLTVSQIDEFKRVKPQRYDGQCKVAKGFKWYIVSIIDEVDVNKMDVGDTVTVEFQSLASESIVAKVEAMNLDSGAKKCALVLSSEYMDSNIARLRNATAVVTANTYSGLLVSADAVHFETVNSNQWFDRDGDGYYDVNTNVTKENVMGVYVQSGEKIVFTQIFPLKVVNGYVICRGVNSNDRLYTDSTIKLYDRVVIGGTNLYDGKIISGNK